MRAARGRETTRESSSTPAARMRATLPKRCSSFCAVRAPTPGISSSSRAQRALGAALAVEGDGETVRLVANLLDEVQQRRMARQADRLVFLPEHVEDFLFLGDGGDGLVDDFEFLEGFGGGVQLAEAAVDQDQAGHGPPSRPAGGVTAVDDFAHGGEIVVAPFAADDELAVVGFLHAAVFPDDHGGHGVGALDVGDVEALDALGRRGQSQSAIRALR